MPRSLLREGRIVDFEGHELGTHTGLHQFTIGQRKGLGVASKEPLFVTEINLAKNEVVVGPEASLYNMRCIVSGLNWINDPGLHNPDAHNINLTARLVPGARLPGRNHATSGQSSTGDLCHCLEINHSGAGPCFLSRGPM